LPLIPPDELKQLSTFLNSAYKRRGFADSFFHIKHAWDGLLHDAQQVRWEDDFAAETLTDEGLQQLGQLIDEHFFGGGLHKKLNSCKRGTVQYKAVQTNKWDNDWIAFFHIDNVLYINKSKWKRPIGPDQAMSCEGVLCTTRLQVLCHTVAHELVHAIIFNVFPRIDKRSPGYLPCSRHGPIFHYMNKHLFGHTSDSYEYVSHRVFSLHSSPQRSTAA
jgi:hypothetical protein